MNDTIKKTYVVTYPILGHVSMTVEAEDEEAAKAAFWASVEEYQGDVLASPGFDEVDYDFVEEVMRGNVCYAQFSKSSVEEA